MSSTLQPQLSMQTLLDVIGDGEIINVGTILQRWRVVQLCRPLEIPTNLWPLIQYYAEENTQGDEDIALIGRIDKLGNVFNTKKQEITERIQTTAFKQ